MRKHITKLLTALLAIVMLLPVTAQAASTDGWTDEAEQAYQTVTELVVQRVSESKDYLAAATQEENAKAVYDKGMAEGLGKEDFRATYKVVSGE